MIFKKFKINGVILQNRIIISPMCQYSADKMGGPSSWHYSHLGSLVKSGAGMLITESVAVSKIGRITPRDLCLYNDRQEIKFKKLIKYLRSINKDMPLCIQISHSGRKGSSFVPWDKNKGSINTQKGGWKTVSPSSIKKDPGWSNPKSLKIKSIKKIISEFVSATKRAKKIGFDGLELHIAHGYLLHQFMSPISNKRKDLYGGNFINRVRIVDEITKKIRSVWPKEKILGARITGSDHVKNGINVNESIKFSEILKKNGFDYACVSSGGIIKQTRLNTKKKMFRINIAKKIKSKSKILISTTGRMNNLKICQKLIKRKQIDMITIGRPFLKNPFWLYDIKEFKKNIPKQIIRGFE